MVGQAVAAQADVIFGAGSIVGDAHLPAYEKGGFPVTGIFDPDLERRANLRKNGALRPLLPCKRRWRSKWGCFRSRNTTFRPCLGTLAIAGGAAALIQKPMGSDLAGATEILKVCRARKLGRRRSISSFALRR